MRISQIPHSTFSNQSDVPLQHEMSDLQAWSYGTMLCFSDGFIVTVHSSFIECPASIENVSLFVGWTCSVVSQSLGLAQAVSTPYSSFPLLPNVPLQHEMPHFQARDLGQARHFRLVDNYPASPNPCFIRGEKTNTGTVARDFPASGLNDRSL